MVRFFGIFLVFSALLITGCTTTDVMFWKNSDTNIIDTLKEEDNVLTNAPNNSDSLIQELNPVPMDEPMQIIAPDTSVSTERASSQIRS